MKRIIIAFLVTIMVTPAIFAQPFDTTFSSAESGGPLTHIARNSITLLSGYQYTPSGGSLTFDIQNPVVTGSESYTYTPVDPELRTLNTSYKPGSTGGGFNIDLSGGATYNIPIEVPPGVNSLAPNLSLVYSSHGGPDIAGFGWDLGGISAIDRGPQTYLFDGSGLAELEERLYLDGQRLVVSGSNLYWDYYGTYRTAQDIFTRITPQNSDQYGPKWFNAETKSGLVYEYGSSLGSTEIASGTNVRLKWYVSKISDLFGNQINFSYLQDQSLPFLGEITYGPNTITFYYKTRIDNIISYRKGTRYEERLILDKITVKYNSSIIKTYELKYNYDYSWSNICSELNEVIEYGIGSDRYNSTAFTYLPPKNVSFSLTTNNTSHADINYKSKLIPGDFNGDGKTDFLCLPDSLKGATWTGMRVYKSNGDDSFTLLFSSTIRINLPRLQDIRALDINGDGFDDILYETKYDNISYFMYILNNNGSTFSSPVQFYSITNPTSKSGLNGKIRRLELQECNDPRTGDDINGDGLNDILINSTPADNGLGQFTIYSFVDYYGVKRSTLNWLGGGGQGMDPDVYTGDFNGDGQDDIWCFDGARLQILSFNYTNSSTTILDLPTTVTKTSFFNLGDFNGDGKTDILLYGSGKGGTEVDYTTWKIMLSTASGFDTYSIPQLKANLKDDNVRLGDFNDDGKTDIMVTSANQSWTGTYYFIAGFNGEDFNYYYMSSEPSTSNYFFLGDFNGDRHCDYISTDKQSPWVTGYKVFRTTTDTAYALNKVANGLGNLTKITYTNLSQAASTVYQRGSGAYYPITDYQGPITVVSSVRVDNGKGSLNTHNYNVPQI